MPNSASQTAGVPFGEAPRQVLTFFLGAENYGVDILRVQEIRGWSPVTRIPKAPLHVLGVLNLRGSVVPIIDLRARFGLALVECTALTVIIVLSVKAADGQRQFGLVVDRVSDVVDITPESIRAMPKLEHQTHNDFIQTLAVVDDQMLILLDVDALISLDIATAALPDIADVA
ncbi:MAG: chemotaxis protein CheW [Steroidobacteraceae bacterium]